MTGVSVIGSALGVAHAPAACLLAEGLEQIVPTTQGSQATLH